MAIPNGYMVYLLRILAAQGALASIYTDPNDPDAGNEMDEQFPDGMFRFEKRMKQYP